MNLGVVYTFKQRNKINGTMFYCYEYFQQIKKLAPIKYYIVGASDEDFEMVKRLFQEKYTTDTEDMVSLKSVTDLYALNLDRTLILDIHTLEYARGFLRNEVHAYSNRPHNMWRYKEDTRKIIYYGMYDYQPRDVDTHLKMNFSIFKPTTTSGDSVFISLLDPLYLERKLSYYEKHFDKPIILKKQDAGIGNLFDVVGHVHYVHTQIDSNNRIIPEAYFFGKTMSYEAVDTTIDSAKLRFDDVQENGLVNYWLDENDIIVKAMTCE